MSRRSPRGAPLRSTSVDVLLLEQPLRELQRVGDGRRRADERRARAVEGADALQAPDDVGDLAAEQAAIRVQLVDDDEVEAREEPAPARVVRQQARVEHVGVGHHDVPAFADGGAPARRGVAVVGVDAQVDGQAVLRARSAPPAGPARAPWSGRGRGLACRAARAGAAGPAGCSRASCRSRSASRRPGAGRGAPPRTASAWWE